MIVNNIVLRRPECSFATASYAVFTGKNLYDQTGGHDIADVAAISPSIDIEGPDVAGARAGLVQRAFVVLYLPVQVMTAASLWTCLRPLASAKAARKTASERDVDELPFRVR